VNITIIIISCVLITIILILLPLYISRKAEKALKKENEWDKIKKFGNKINKNTRKKN